ncbi:HK97-gp10 family putative phage morphogenesis protein [Burkholderia gladioli]|uniref:HK97-gp10 family putative phage morphogenesis protein n=1 Tax=Burkholderia gladioli TaxID=28095 RepID=UPI00163F2473|nr:HK97-gp10 family putative phage morphogenesis protein [Burkholderia gladioli]
MAKLKHIQGLDELYAALRQLPDNISRNVLRGMVNAGATVIRQECVVLAPVYEGDDPRADPGLIKRSIFQKQIPERSNKQTQTFYVGVRVGKGRTVKLRGRVLAADAWYWRFPEFGTAKMAAKPFMRPAFEARKEAAIEAMKRYAEERLPKEFEKLGLTYKP